jgi:hypothetical protein
MREKKALRRSSECIHREETSMTSVCKLSNDPALIAEFFKDASSHILKRRPRERGHFFEADRGHFSPFGRNTRLSKTAAV